MDADLRHPRKPVCGHRTGRRTELKEVGSQMVTVSSDAGSCTPEFLGNPGWAVVGSWALPQTRWRVGHPRAKPVPSPQLLPETHSGTPSSVQGCAKPSWGKLPKQTSQAVPIVRSPLRDALKVFTRLLSPPPSFSKWELHKISPGLLLLLELS